MANSSFDYFRKNSKFAVILLGVLCIMAFVVADPLMQWMNAAQTGGSASRRGEVAVTWDGGKLTEGELSSLVSKRNILVAFLRQVEQMGAYEAMLAGAPANLPTRVQPLRLPTEYEQGVERDVLQKKILADAARKTGMVIGDETIVDYLMALGRDRVDINAMREMISNINLGRTRATPEFMFDLLREALLAQSYLSSYAYTQATVTPDQRWNDWLKVNDRVVVETAALDVDGFVSEVDSPSESELEEYFEKYRDVIAAPEIVDNRELPSPTPGFRKPAKAKLQYVRTSYEEALAAAMDEVTEEEIAEYYETNKTQFVKLGGDLLMSEDDLEVEPVDDTPDEPADPADSEDSGSDSETPASEADADSTDADSVEESAADAENDETTSPAPEQSSVVGQASPFRLASFQEEEDAADDAAAEETVEVEAEAEPATTEEADDANVLDEFMAGGDDEAPTDEQAADDSPTAPAAESEEPEVQYQPLEEVSEEIRDTLAQRKAVESQRQKVDDLLAVLKRDYNVYFTQRIDAEAAGETPPEPAEALVDFKKLAADNGLQFGETELLTFFQMQEMEDPQLMYYFQQVDQARPLAVQVFRRGGMELYEPDSAYDTDRNFYLVMKIEAVEESEPTLDDIRDEVVAAWKHEKAAELALAKAKELAKEATDAGRSLEDLFGNRSELTIAESDMFAWLEPVGASATGMYALRLDDPGSIEGAGPDFMKEVFSLGPNEVGAALDNGQDHAYLIRVSQREKSRSELRQAFLSEWQVWPGIFSMQRDHVRDATRAVVMDLLGGVEPDWKRTADVSPMDREAAEGA
ncbi:periplasmic folding chaperone [Posidoniimonas corsicana]|uniref:Periplasmic folding chaperone n=1 Tax=Posidoniimonas corsicana TaxID=1938618 RepID=A0A5C5VEE8_9BACT|nr:hypothetical protein [Posidoniimonas corsicana]TWT36290.1 periplasmic folding chaperone [Posidoniimonas corsicana]